MTSLGRKLRRDIRSQWAQFLAVVITVFLGTTLFLATADAARNLEESYVQVFDELRFADLTVTGGDIDLFAAEAASTPGVASVERRVTADIPFQIGDRSLLGRVHSLPAEHQPTVNQVRIRDGDYLDPARPTGVLVENHAAEHFDLAPGDAFTLVGPDGLVEVEVLGVVSTGEYLWPARSRQDVFPAPDNFAVVFAPTELAASLTGSAGAGSEALVYLSDDTDDAASTSALAERARELGAETVVARDEQASNATLRTDIEAFGDLAVVFPVLFLSAAALATYVLLTRRVRAERAVIGAMAANGVSRRSIRRHYLSYGLVAAAFGAVPGVAAGVLLGGVTTGLYADAIGIPDARSTLHLSTALVALVVGLGVGAVAAIAPALWASRLTPAEAMRADTPATSGRLSLAERVVPPLRRLPARWRMALRGPGRNPRRTAFTVIGVVFSITLILVSWAMLDSTVEFVDRQYTEVERHDARVFFDGEPSESDLVRVENVPGVAEAEVIPQVPVVLQAGDGRYETLLAVYEPMTAMHGFRVVDGPDRLPDRGVLLGVAAQDDLGVEVGDELAVLVAGSGASAVSVAGFVDEPLGTFAYMSTDQAELLGEGSLSAATSLVLVAFDSDVDREVVTAELSTLGGVVAVEDAQVIADLVDDLLGAVYAFVVVMLVFGATMAFALLFAAMSVNVSERSVELVTLRANGMPRRSLSQVITVENMFVALLGILPGLWLGRRVGEAVMANYTNDLFAFGLHLAPRTIILTVLAVLVVTLLSQWPGLRAIGRLDIATVAREHSL